ncbi:hypothetical protein B0H11DRAFT_1908075 [Mycena galericulata]|nr:hypothetical protein B0H11DRAFT_1908075 [Mycena galericulata]
MPRSATGSLLSARCCLKVVVLERKKVEWATGRPKETKHAQLLFTSSLAGGAFWITRGTLSSYSTESEDPQRGSVKKKIVIYFTGRGGSAQNEGLHKGEPTRTGSKFKQQTKAQSRISMRPGNIFEGTLFGGNSMRQGYKIE